LISWSFRLKMIRILFFLILFLSLEPGLNCLLRQGVDSFNASNPSIQYSRESFTSPRKKIIEQDFSSAFLTTNCLAYYQFDGNTQDACSLAQHCTGGGVTTTNGKNGVANTAYNFDANNAHYLNCGFSNIQAKDIKQLLFGYYFEPLLAAKLLVSPQTAMGLNSCFFKIT
jgi:hypothetical protein